MFLIYIRSVVVVLSECGDKMRKAAALRLFIQALHVASEGRIFTSLCHATQLCFDKLLDTLVDSGGFPKHKK